MTSRHLLVVTYYYPPQPTSGSNRWLAMAKYLRRLGHDVTVVTAAPPGHEPGVVDDVLRTANLNSSRVLRAILLRPDRTTATPADTALPNRVAPPWVWKAIVPDAWVVTWLPYAWRAVRRELARHPIDCLITSSPVHSTHLLGPVLGPSRPAWVADFRDGWLFEPIREPFPTAPQRSLDRSLERLVATSADVIVGVTRPIAEDFKIRFGAESMHIPNGFDPEVTPDDAILRGHGGQRITFVHTGPLLGHSGRNARPLLRAMRVLLDEDPSLVNRVQLIVAGRSEFDERALPDEAGVADVVRHLGYVPRAQALALQKAATALVLVTSSARGEATGKLYEYLGAGRPIIALADGNEAARIVSETGTGIVVPPGDVEAIASALRSVIAGELERSYAPKALEAYVYPSPAVQMAEAVERAIEARQG